MPDRRQWGDREETLFGALTEALGPASGDGGRSQKAFREAARRLARANVEPQALSLVFYDYGLACARTLGPMVLAAHIAGAEPRDPRFLIVNRWPTSCGLCDQEIARGELAWFRKPPGAARATLTCGSCEEIPFTSERADVARKRALERDDDPDSLLTALLERTPPSERNAVEDALPLDIFMAREAES